MENITEIYNLLTSNWEGIVVIVMAALGLVGKICTMANIFFPKVMTDGKLAKVQTVIANCSFGTKKAEIIKK